MNLEEMKELRKHLCVEENPSEEALTVYNNLIKSGMVHIMPLSFQLLLSEFVEDGRLETPEKDCICMHKYCIIKRVAFDIAYTLKIISMHEVLPITTDFNVLYAVIAGFTSADFGSFINRNLMADVLTFVLNSNIKKEEEKEHINETEINNTLDNLFKNFKPGENK